MNEVEALPQMMLQQVANDVMLRINDVALRANGGGYLDAKHKVSFTFQQRYAIIDAGRR